MFTLRLVPTLLFGLACVLAGPLSAATAPPTPWPTQAQVQGPMQQRARRAAEQPMKLDIRALTQRPHVGDKVSIEVVLLDADNRPATWNRPCQVHVGVTGPSQKTEEYTVTIPPRQSAAQFTIGASEAGLFSLKARETNHTLLPGGNSVLIGPKATARKSDRLKHGILRFAPAQSLGQVLTIAAHSSEPPTPVAAAGGTQQEPTGTAHMAAPASARLLLIRSSGSDEIWADGAAYARIQVYYMDPQREAAPSNIKVWLRWSNGNLDPQPLPLLIKKGESFAETKWTSLSPVTATLSLVSSAPKYEVEGQRELQLSFVPPIYGIAPSNPNPLRLSLIDCELLVAQFFDRGGHTVQTSKPRHITVISSNPSLHLDPADLDVPPNGSGASIFLIPTWSGKAKLDIWTPGYDHQTLVVEVTMWLVVLLCLGGGVIGGIAAWEALKGAVTYRIFAGMLGAIVLVWLCVYAVLPRTRSVIAHNLVSVFVVGIVGGYGGTRVLDFAGKKLGYL